MNNSITILDMIEGLQDVNPDMFNTLEYLIRKWIDDENISLPTREQYNSVKGIDLFKSFRQYIKGIYNIFKGMSETVAYTWFEIVLLKTIIYPAPEDNLQEPTPDFEDADDIEQYLREENS